MSRSTQYKTKQKQDILNYLKLKSGENVDVNDIIQYLDKVGTPIAIATVYRILEQMISNGIVKKYYMSGNASAHFLYVGDTPNEPSTPFFYLKCDKCGKIVRYESPELKRIQKRLSSKNGFTLDSILCGICNECLSKQPSKK